MLFVSFDELGVGIWVHGGMSTGVQLWLSFLIFRTRYVRYFMDIRCKCFKSFLTSQGDILSFLGL